MADKWQTECTNTLRKLDLWTDKTRDAYFDPKSKRWVYPDTGFPDMRIFANAKFESDYPMVVFEVKTGDITRFAFDGWRDTQREWYEKYAKQFKNYYWLYIMFGKAINSKQYPRRPLLIQAERFLEIEKELSRKSMPYDIAESTGLMLSWNTTTQSWSFKGHPFEKTFMRERTV